MAQLEDLPKLRIILFIDVIFVSLANILILGLIGFFIDTYFQIKPIGILISVIASFPITILFLVKRIKKLV